MLFPVIAGALIALGFSAPPGPVAVETIRRGLRGGFQAAFQVQLGSIIGDVLWFAVAMLGLAPFVQVVWVRALLAVAGGAVLFYFGYGGLRDALRFSGFDAYEKSVVDGNAFRSGMAISLANPMAVGYWLSIGGALAAAGLAEATASQAAWFVAGFLGAVLLWAFVMASAVGWGKRKVQPLVFRVVIALSGVGLIGFGIALVVTIVRELR